MTGYTIINHGMLLAFIERWHLEVSSFHLLQDDMSITLDDVSSLLHLWIKGRLLDHSRMSRPDALYMMVTYSGTDLEDDLKELEDTKGCHARFPFLEKLYIHHLVVGVEIDGDYAHVMHHRAYALRSYLMYFVSTSIFVDKSSCYIDVVYLRNFIYF